MLVPAACLHQFNFTKGWSLCWKGKKYDYDALGILTADSLFLATISADIIETLNGAPIIWDSALINPGGHFNTDDGAYTAPVDGYYTWVIIFFKEMVNSPCVYFEQKVFLIK